MLAFRVAVLGTVLLSLAVGGFHSGPPSSGRRIDLDFVDSFATTTAAARTHKIALASPLGLAHLRAGWSGPEQLPGGEQVIFGIERRSRLQIELGPPEKRELVLTCAAPASGEQRQRVMVNVNGQRLGLLRLSRELHESRFALPAQHQREGENTLELVNPKLSASPRRRRSGRQPARIACSEISIETIGQEGPSKEARLIASTDGDAILLPAGAKVEYYARLGADPELQLDYRSASPLGTQLLLTIDGSSNASIRRLAKAGPTPSRTSLDLTRFASDLVRFTVANQDATSLEFRGKFVSKRNPAGRTRSRTLRPPLPPEFILLFVIDTLRADHLGAYGYDRNVSPNIDKLASEALLLENVVAQSSWTTPATGSILTGVTPSTHGAEHLAERMRHEVPSLAASLQKAGWKTGAFVTNTNVRSQLGFGRGFEAHHLLNEDTDSASIYPTADELVDAALPWLDDAGGTRTFLYLHATDPHGPYNPSPPFRDRYAPNGASADLLASADPLELFRSNPKYETDVNFDLVVARYDEEIAYTDSVFGRLREELERRGLWENAVVIVTSDHGEEFLEHERFGHGRTLYSEQLHIPLVIRVPGAPSFRDARLARQIDIAPTILDSVGLTPPVNMEGESLLGERTIRDATSRSFLGSSDLHSRTTETRRYIQKRSPEGRIVFEAYDLTLDPGETSSLVDDDPVLKGWLRQTFLADRIRRLVTLAGNDRDRALEVDAATRKRLEALGYLDEDDPIDKR